MYELFIHSYRVHYVNSKLYYRKKWRWKKQMTKLLEDKDDVNLGASDLMDKAAKEIKKREEREEKNDKNNM